jgi:hypothetical protein
LPPTEEAELTAAARPAPQTAGDTRHDGVRKAAHDLAALCGLDMRHFRYPGHEADPAAFGSHPWVMGCEVVDHFGRMGPGEGPHAADRLLRERIRTSYRHATWVAHYKALNAAFLAHEGDRRIPSPLSGGEATILGSVPIGPYQFTLCLDGERLVVAIGIGYMAVGILYPAEALFLVLTPYPLNMRSVLRVFMDHMLQRPQTWLGWIHRAQAGSLRRAYLIGDNRPGHFIRQSLAYLDAQEAEIHAFSAAGGLLLPVPDWCAMDPFTLIPGLAPLERREVPSEALTLTVLQDGHDAHRVYRFDIHRDPSWLRRRFAALAPVDDVPALPGRRFRVLISIDAESGRFLNQEEAFRFVLRQLVQACARDGRILDVAWDGWTVPGVPSPRDLEILERIEAVVGRITKGLSGLGEQLRLFGRSAQEKVPAVAECDLAFVTQGTGAVIPCWLLKRPTVIYHVASMVQDRSCLDDTVAFNVDQRAVIEMPPEEGRPVHQRRFSLAHWGLDEAMRRALGGSLDLGEVEPATLAGD